LDRLFGSPPRHLKGRISRSDPGRVAGRHHRCGPKPLHYPGVSTTACAGRNGRASLFVTCNPFPGIRQGQDQRYDHVLMPDRCVSPTGGLILALHGTHPGSRHNSSSARGPPLAVSKRLGGKIFKIRSGETRRRTVPVHGQTGRPAIFTATDRSRSASAHRSPSQSGSCPCSVRSVHQPVSAGDPPGLVQP
jgi:hypothetical protein